MTAVFHRQRGGASIGFLLLLLGALAFVWLTGQQLPARVAAHFDAAGQANGFMPRELYTRFILFIVALVPATVVLVPNLALSVANPRLNLPNRDYWLAPERRAATVRILRRHSLQFGSCLLLFLCYAHWLVVRANVSQPPGLSSSWFIGGLVVFIGGMLLSVLNLLFRFRRVQG